MTRSTVAGVYRLTPATPFDAPPLLVRLNVGTTSQTVTPTSVSTAYVDFAAATLAAGAHVTVDVQVLVTSWCTNVGQFDVPTTTWVPNPSTAPGGTGTSIGGLVVGDPVPRHGHPVTVLAVNGLFATTSNPTLTVEIDGPGLTTPVAIPASRVTWTGPAVSFTVPNTLPTSPDPTAYQVTLRPAMGSAFGPFLMLLTSLPEVTFIEPVTVSERGAVVLCTSASAGSSVSFVDSQDKPVVPGGPEAVPVSDVGFLVQMPTITALQGSDDYDPNQLAMRLRVSVRDKGSQKSSPLPPLAGPLSAAATLVQMPLPVLGPVRLNSDVQPHVLEIGSSSSGSRPSELGDVESCEWLGRADSGEVRFYPGAVPPAVADLRSKLVAPLQGALTHELNARPADVQAADAIRRAGVRLPVANGEWHEEWIRADASAITESGFVVVWRDALPSAPAAVVVPTLPTVIPPLIIGAAEVLSTFAIRVNPAPIPCGVPAMFAVERIQGVTTTLSQLLDRANSPASISFTYSVKPVGAAAAETTLGTLPMSGPAPTGSTVTGLLPAPVEPWTTAGQTASALYELQITARVVLAGATLPPVVLPKVTFTQLGMVIPTVVLGFPEKHFETREPFAFGAEFLHIWVHPSVTPIVSLLGTDKVLDGRDNNPNKVATVLAALADALSVLTGPLQLLSAAGALPVPLGVASLTVVGQVINAVRLAPADKTVIDGFVSNDDLSYRRPNVEDAVESVFLFGAGGGPALRLTEDKGWVGRFVELRVPPGAVVADFWSLWSYPVSTIAAATMLPMQDGKPYSMFDRASSSAWVV